MNTWRPNDWEEIKDCAIGVATTVKQSTRESVIYEAGADAMYEPAYQRGRQDEREALRNEGEHFNWDKRIITVKVPNVFRSKFKGCFVFIPDNEVTA